MASVEKDVSRARTPWVCRWRDEAGEQRKKGFARKLDADRFRSEIEHSLAVGSYIDPAAGRRTFRAVAEAYRLAQPHRPNTAGRWRSQLTKHVYPVLGDRPIGSIRPTEVQAFVTGLSMVMAPGSVKTIYATVRAVFGAAVHDRLIASTPCTRRITMPAARMAEIVPLTVAQVEALADAIEPRYRALVVVGAGVGLRQGEVFGLQPAPDLDFLRKTLRVERQVQPAVGGGTEVCPPKNKHSYRTVPVADVVLSEVTAHMQAYPGGKWLFCTEDGKALSRSAFNDRVWDKARTAAAAAFRVEAAKTADRDARAELLRRAVQLETCGMHDLRHFFASALIRAGANPKVVAKRLGHANAAMTLNVYAHLWPDDEDRTRQAIEDVFTHDRQADVPTMRPRRQA